jgi:hypothetical protein
VATWTPVVLNTIRDLGLELQVVFNKRSWFSLRVNKASGLPRFDDLHLSPHNVVGIGDTENDPSCSCVNALPSRMPWG